jgi:hypothetical protein
VVKTLKHKITGIEHQELKQTALLLELTSFIPGSSHRGKLAL